jgi:serine/threonine protein kinase
LEFVEREEIASGGFGKVFRAKQVSLGDIVQDVILKTPYGKNVPAFREAEETMREESRILAKINHPNIVRSQGYFSVSIDCSEARAFGLCAHPQDYKATHELPVLVLEDGGASLDTVLGTFGGRVDEARAAYIATELLRGLGHLHEMGIVHRDIKPSNVLIGLTGEVKLADLGIAKDKLSPKESTKIGATKGTVFYMAPEALLVPPSGGTRVKLDGRADIWAVGVLLYKLVSGRYPWHCEKSTNDVAFFVEWSHKIACEPIVELPEEQVSKELFDVIRKCLARDRDDRYEDASQVIHALQALAFPSRWYAAQELAHYARVALGRASARAQVSAVGHSCVTVPVNGVARQAARSEPRETVSVSVVLGPDVLSDYYGVSAEYPVQSEERVVEVAAGLEPNSEMTARVVVESQGSRSPWILPRRGVAAASLVGAAAFAVAGWISLREPAVAETGGTVAASPLVAMDAPSNREVQEASPYLADGVGAHEVVSDAQGISASAVSESMSSPQADVAQGISDGLAPDSDGRSGTLVADRPVRAVTGSLEVILYPRGAFVSLDGRAPVKAPVTFNKLRRGTHVLRVGLSAESLTKEEKVSIKEGENRIRVVVANPFSAE